MKTAKVALTILAIALALELETEMKFAFSDDSTSSDSRETDFVKAVQQELRKKTSHNKTTIEKLARQRFGIDNQNKVKELTELAIVQEARKIAFNEKLNFRQRFERVVELYRSQVNLSHRTSMSVLLQQYSTPAPISFMAGLWVKKVSGDAGYFEPSAGNGLLCHTLPYNQLHVNELDKIRLQNLNRQPFKTITSLDASLPFGFGRIYDGIITNPPFGDLEAIEQVEGFHIKKLEHIMAIRSLETLKDDGRAAIIIGGHTRYNPDSGVITNKGDRYFLNFLYHFYHVEDIIPIDGHKLYSRQGTAFNTRLILIAGRKETPGGIANYAPEVSAKNRHLREVVSSFDELYERILNCDIRHFLDLAAQKPEAEHLFKTGDRVSFLATGNIITNGIVTGLPRSGIVEITIKSQKEPVVLQESQVVPELFACKADKREKGYKAFSKVQFYHNRTWTARFIDGEEITVGRVFNNREARIAAVKERLKQRN
ncbi:hypothetical protein [Marinilabilia salmonicolor]|uniref:Uncharacterized protein n=1 Tax=Marinilabilia salmonicolor TaxID=989 RepID=A0A368ULX0_9BACT|nr:hypothetical protein [Marinilabilia salmonicolor]RCW29663.1 hypothetical protein DFO77_12620 [Marinilabilia salmonicolor]